MKNLNDVLRSKKTQAIKNERYTQTKDANLLADWLVQNYFSDLIYQLESTTPFKAKFTILCPFDTEQSEIVKELRKFDCFDVIASSSDFFQLDDEYFGGVDMIISNPPFEFITQITKRVIDLKIPSVLLYREAFLDAKKRYDLFASGDNTITYLIPRDRYTFKLPDGNGGSKEFDSIAPPFKTIWVMINCYDENHIYFLT